MMFCEKQGSNLCRSVLHAGTTILVLLRDERMLRVFEYRVLRRVFGSKRDEVTEEWRIRS